MKVKDITIGEYVRICDATKDCIPCPLSYYTNYGIRCIIEELGDGITKEEEAELLDIEVELNEY